MVGCPLGRAPDAPDGINGEAAVPVAADPRVADKPDKIEAAEAEEDADTVGKGACIGVLLLLLVWLLLL